MDVAAVVDAHRKMKPDRALLERAAAGREAVDRGADPALILSLVVWPTVAIDEAREGGTRAMGTG